VVQVALEVLRLHFFSEAELLAVRIADDVRLVIDEEWGS